MAKLSADVVIVGSGVAGAMIAHQLAKSGISVLVLEAGPRIARWRVVENFRNTPDKNNFMAPYPSTPYAPHPEYSPENNYLISKGERNYSAQYIRAVGGTTWNWKAAAWRNLTSDFDLKSRHGVGRDWPIGYDDLEPYYYQAEVELGVSGPNDGTDLGSPREQPYPMNQLPFSWNDQRFRSVLSKHGHQVVSEPVARNSQVYDNRPNCCGNNNCMPICPIGAMYSGIVHVEKAERAGAKILPNAVVYQIEAGKNNRINAVHYKTPNGISHRVTAKYFILAANGIEIPKLMLISTDQKHSKGMGNSSNQVGRNLMDHPGTSVSFLANEDLWPGRGPIEMSSIVSMRDGTFRSDYAGKKLQLNNMAQTLQATQAALKMGLVGKKLDQEIRHRAARMVNISSYHEMLPVPVNRIVPSRDQKDALGIPKPEITFSFGSYVEKSAAKTHAVFAEIARMFNGTEVIFNDNFSFNNHIMGTTIMGTDPRNSVVDANCRTHDHENLFIASSSVMPSSGTVDCTLTIAALSLRIADTLRAEL
jgi:choline dehydrogenase-like flavoprotein